jgi:hypothetical protein
MSYLRRTAVIVFALAVACEAPGPASSVGASLSDDVAPDASAEDIAADGAAAFPLDHVLRLNHVQAKGTHNSYHMAPELLADPSHGYSHAPLDVQAGELGVRQFELDLHYRSGTGLVVFHLPVIDEETTCERFVDCLAVLAGWSASNPQHCPLVVWLEPKDEIDGLFAGFEPLEGRYAEIEEEILSVWPRDRLLLPDDVRRGRATLPVAIQELGWPTLGEVRGKAAFALLDSGEHRDAYIGAAHNLEGRVLFVDSSRPDDDFAAFFKDASPTEARALAEQGFIVTSNVSSWADADDEAHSSTWAHLAAGTHFLATDLPGPVDGKRYYLDVPGGTPARCNPVSAPPECTSQAIEHGAVR